MATRRNEANPPKRSLTPREVAVIRKLDEEINRVITEHDGSANVDDERREPKSDEPAP
ncbi:MAG TPA: hypothetical protein VFZ53_17760 [Polyangiaceae bacterium]